MNKVTIKGKMFRTFIPETDILKRVKAVAEQINTGLAGKEPLFLAMLNDSFVLAADLVRYITIPSETSSVKLTSYQGIASTGVIKEVIGLSEDTINRHVVIVEDIVDIRAMIRRMIETLGMRGQVSVDIYTSLLKSDKLSAPLDIRYIVMEIPNDFTVGYRLDCEQQGRNLRDIYILVEE